MNRWAWAMLLGTLGVLGYAVTLSLNGSSEPDLVELLHKERQLKIAAVTEQIEREKKDLQRVVEADSANDSAQAPPSIPAPASNEEEATKPVVFKPAIPELPEVNWASTRSWNLPLNNPAIVSAPQALFLSPEDTVCGVLLGDHARAYPWFVLANYHCINDQIDGVPIIVNLCEACNGGAAFHAGISGATLDFRPRGLKNGTWYAEDFQTNSSWYPFIGEAFAGPLKGTKLDRVRLYFSTWRDWVRDHPKTTVVLSSDEVRDRPHGKSSHMADEEIFSIRLLRRLVGGKKNPKRSALPGYELVFGLIPPALDVDPIAYRLNEIIDSESPIQTHIGDIPVVLFVQNQYQVGAYVRTLGDSDLNLQIVSEAPLRLEDQLGNVWNAWGRTESGPDHPSELKLANGYLAKWYEWIENFPETKLSDER